MAVVVAPFSFPDIKHALFSFPFLGIIIRDIFELTLYYVLRNLLSKLFVTCTKRRAFFYYFCHFNTVSVFSSLLFFFFLHFSFFHSRMRYSCSSPFSKELMLGKKRNV